MSTVNQWKFISENSQIVASDGTLIVSTDDINVKVAERIVELNNAGEYSKISSYLEQTSLCAPDEREFLNEQLSEYRSSVVSKLPTLDEVEKLRDKASDGKMSTESAELGTVKKLSGEEPKVPSPLKGKPRNQVANTAKALTPDEAIALMEEKLVLMKHFRAITVPEFDSETVISKKGMNLMKEFQSQFENLVSTYIQQIQGM